MHVTKHHFINKLVDVQWATLNLQVVENEWKLYWKTVPVSVVVAPLRLNNFLLRAELFKDFSKSLRLLFCLQPCWKLSKWNSCIYKTCWTAEQTFWDSSSPLCLHFSLVSAEQGKVLKVLHTSEEVFIISQYSLFHNKGPVLNMAIDSQKVWGPPAHGVVDGGMTWLLHSP